MSFARSSSSWGSRLRSRNFAWCSGPRPPRIARSPCIRIYSTRDWSENAFLSISYRNYWFWIDDGDLQTKRALTAVMFFFTLADTGANDNLPLITIPAQ